MHEGWQEGHRRLYEYLTKTTHDKPKPLLEELQPLYQAVGHGCKAGLYEEARAKVQEYIQHGCTCPIMYPVGGDVRLLIDTFAQK